jgi:uncharacterized protein YqgC (DUF456 family)
MKPLDTIKVALLLSAILIWFFGYQAHDRMVMYIGVGVMALAFLLRFLKPAPPAPPGPPTP